MLELFFLIVLGLASMAFHEWGHKIVASQHWIGYELKFPKGFFCHSFVQKMTVNQFMIYCMAGFIFSCPIIVLSFFILSSPFVIGLILFNIWISLTDFLTYFWNLLVLVANKKTGCLDKTIGELRGMK